MSSSLGLDLKADDFTLFGVPRAFEQDPAELARRWRELQGAVHPDRFATEGAASQRVAMRSGPSASTRPISDSRIPSSVRPCCAR